MKQLKLTLLLQEIRPTAEASEVLRATFARATQELLSLSLWRPPLATWIKGKPHATRTHETTEATLKEVVRSAKSGVVVSDTTSKRVELDIRLRASGITMICRLPLDDLESIDGLEVLTTLGTSIWQVCSNEAVIGPGFSIHSLNLDYPRPLPPRDGYLWIPGDVAYLIDHRFHETQPDGDKDGLAAIRSIPPPPGVIKTEMPGLTIVRCQGPASDKSAFAAQAAALEAWLSTTLKLPVHPDFKANGDKRIEVTSKEFSEPFTFYDSLTSTGFKAVAETRARALDNGTLRDLAEVFSASRLADGRRVNEKIAVFPTRNAALHSRDVMVRIGASSTVYVDDDGTLWEPAPRGNWIEMTAVGEAK